MTSNALASIVWRLDHERTVINGSVVTWYVSRGSYCAIVAFITQGIGVGCSSFAVTVISCLAKQTAVNRRSHRVWVVGSLWAWVLTRVLSSLRAIITCRALRVFGRWAVSVTVWTVVSFGANDAFSLLNVWLVVTSLAVTVVGVSCSFRTLLTYVTVSCGWIRSGRSFWAIVTLCAKVEGKCSIWLRLAEVTSWANNTLGL